MFGLVVSKCLPLLFILCFCFQDVLGRTMRLLPLPDGLENDDIVEWRGRIPKKRVMSTMLIKDSSRGLFRLDLKPYMRQMIINRRYIIHNVGKISPGKSFKLQVRIGKNFTVYINHNFQGAVRMKDGLPGKIRLVKTIGPVQTTFLKKLTIEDFAAKLNEDGCGRSEDSELEDSLNKICQLDGPSVVKLTRIVGGTAAIPTANPWQAAIRIRRKYTNKGKIPHVCGASLINECWAISAAHCFPVVHSTQLKTMVLRVGDYFNNDTDPDHNKQFSAHENVQDLSIEKVFKHKGYKFSHKSNDIALIKLKTCANLGRFVKPVCLPASSARSIYKGKCTISGWGAAVHSQDKKKYPKCLQQARVNINPGKTCKRLYKGSVYNNNVMLCAGGIGGIDACQGDSGGPLVCGDNKRGHTLVGVTSWGVTCGDDTHPGVYTRLSYFMKWIYIQIKLEYRK